MSEPWSLDPNNLYIGTASESHSRSSVVLPDGPSEDARHVLGQPPTTAAPSQPEEERDYGPDESVEWVISIAIPEGEEISKDRIRELLPTEWLVANGSPTLYGRSPGTGRWTFVHAADTPSSFTGLQLGWRYIPLDFPEEQFTAASAHQYLDAAQQALAAHGSARVTSAVSPNDAAARSVALQRLVQSCSQEIDVVLVAPAGQHFEGRAIWDALTSLGLEWGDMDLFHWENPSQEAGNDHLFSVATSTSPGYFFPEEAASGRLRTRDLIFGFSLARTYQPEAVFDAMMRAIRYAQRRLGGEITGAEGPLDEAAIRRQIQQTTGEMGQAGMAPGEGAAMFLF